MKDHGGNLDAAIAQYGGRPDDWVDLSTGINARAYPSDPPSKRAWSALPTQSDKNRLTDAAAEAFATNAPIVALAGAQAAIQAVPGLLHPTSATVLEPTYNEHAGALRAAGWQVSATDHLGGLAGADLAVVVNPNNPDGATHAPADLLELARETGLLVIDESFVDCVPGLSAAGHLSDATENVIILRSFGKFYGLAGLRLGFAITGAALAGRIEAMAGPWPVSGAAIDIGVQAYRDDRWQAATVARLQHDARRLDGLAAQAGWPLVGGTPLFRLYETPNARAAQHQLAQARIWSRIFPYSNNWIRLGLPDGAPAWRRVEAALR